MFNSAEESLELFSTEVLTKYNSLNNNLTNMDEKEVVGPTTQINVSNVIDQLYNATIEKILASDKYTDEEKENILFFAEYERYYA